MTVEMQSVECVAGDVRFFSGTPIWGVLRITSAQVTDKSQKTDSMRVLVWNTVHASTSH
jgi:hypothetical protein